MDKGALSYQNFFGSGSLGKIKWMHSGLAPFLEALLPTSVYHDTWLSFTCSGTAHEMIENVSVRIHVPPSPPPSISSAPVSSSLITGLVTSRYTGRNKYINTVKLVLIEGGQCLRFTNFKQITYLIIAYFKFFY